MAHKIAMISKTLALCLAFLPKFVGAQESLLIGKGDQIHIHVVEAPELDESVRVTDAGEAPISTCGVAQVLGLTPFQASGQVKHALQACNWLKSPSVVVTVEQYATQAVSVIGEVKLPGAYNIGTPRPLLDVLSLAQGLTDTADRDIAIAHPGKPISHFFLTNDSGKAITDQPLIYPGDSIVVPRAEVVYALGDLPRAGGYARVTTNSQITVLELMSLAGSTPPSAAPSHSRLLRKNPDGTYAMIEINIADMQKGKTPDIALRANDIVYVPFSYLRNLASSLGGIITSAESAAIYKF